MESLQDRIFKQGLVSVVIASLCVCSTSITPATAEVNIQNPTPESPSETHVILRDQKKVLANTNVENDDATKNLEKPQFTASRPTVKVESTTGFDGMTMLYIGGAIGIATIGAIALGGGSSSGSGPVLPPTPIVGPDLNGADWTGFLDIQNTVAEGYQNIAASIVQNGSSVHITTTSTLLYGRMFTGTINSAGYMTMYDTITGEDWTTHYRNATETTIDLYDYVNNFNDLDRMYLSR